MDSGATYYLFGNKKIFADQDITKIYQSVYSQWNNGSNQWHWKLQRHFFFIKRTLCL